MNNLPFTDHVRRFTERLFRDEVNLHGMMLSVAGETVAEGYAFPFRKGEPHRMYSVSKTLTGIAVGMLADKGKLRLDEPIATFFSEWMPEDPPAYLLRLTVRDMLRMATCYRKTAYREGSDENWAMAFFSGEPDHEPGTIFCYDTGCSQVLAALVRRLSGREVIDFLEEHLFQPLGCEDRRYWLRDPSGCCQGGTGLCMSLRDLHRVARCLMNDGEGIVPAWYVKEMCRKQIDTFLQEKGEERWGYGWQCWMTRGGWAMYGMGGQLAVVCPDKKLILCTIADTRLDPCGVQKIYDAFFDEIAPYVITGGNFEGAADGLPLNIQLPSIGLPDCGCRVPFTLREYRFSDGNDLKLTRLRLRDTEAELERPGQTARIVFRRGEALVVGYPGAPETPAVITAGWAAENLLRIRCHAIGDAPCGFEMLISLRDGRVTVQSRCSSDPLTVGYNGIASGTLEGG